MASKERILTIAHAHPDFSLGGGEIAAHRLFSAYREHPGVEESWFLGRAEKGRGASGLISLRRPGEYLWEQGVTDWQNMKATNRHSLTTWFADLIRALKPSIVHTHHYAHLGLEYLRIIKQVDPSIRIFLTLHEYMAICQNNGQMIKTGSFKLCSHESFDDCRQCFPQSSPEDFWLRKHRFQSFFELVEGFIAPSEFLRQRYIQWGLKPEKIVVIENGQVDEPRLEPRPLRKGEKRNRFGFFGQINPYKGIDVLLEAVTQMDESERRQIKLEIHGANLELQTAEFQEKILNLRAPLIKEGVIRWVGPYQPHELRSRMAGVDWILVPSIWWENSPMVIQEAFMVGRPVISSDIGGMAEKVTHGVDGLNVFSGSRMHWSSTLLAATEDPQLWSRLSANIRRPITPPKCADVHLDFFSCRADDSLPTIAIST